MPDVQDRVLSEQDRDMHFPATQALATTALVESHLRHGNCSCTRSRSWIKHGGSARCAAQIRHWAQHRSGNRNTLAIPNPSHSLRPFLRVFLASYSRLSICGAFHRFVFCHMHTPFPNHRESDMTLEDFFFPDWRIGGCTVHSADHLIDLRVVLRTLFLFGLLWRTVL
jgi:hypothetical protein